MPREFWQHKQTGEIWTVELDDDSGEVVGTTGPLYIGDYYGGGREVDYTDEDMDILESRDNDWFDDHRDEFIAYGDEDEVG